MNHRSIKIIFAVFLISINSEIFAQGISRSNGLGLRVGFWNITNHPTRISMINYGENASVDIGGAGAWLYFFSRVHNNWFLELNLGTIGGVHEEHTDYIIGNVETTAIVPFLFGLRHDLLSPKLPTSLQPYLTVGAGPYWTASIKTKNQSFFKTEQTMDSDLKYGAYAGGGLNLLITSWLALNFDLKYHFVEFEFEKGYSGLEFGMGFNVMWGKKQDIFQIKEIKLIVKDIYPAYYQFYNTYPIALISIKNVAGYPIDVKIKSNIKLYSERQKESGYIRIEQGKTKDIPVTVILGKRLLQSAKREPAVLDKEIEARAGRTLKKSISAQIIVHSRNAWNGEMDRLSLFVTPDDEQILNLSRKIISEKQLDNSSELNNFNKARILFDELKARGIHYHSDPNIIFYKDDRVQYASETLELNNGDCDDLVVLYSSLLESLGINTAFVEVRDPQKDIAHLYLLFDSGLLPNMGHLISSNEKRYIVRKKLNEQQSIWIPVETTLIERGFDEAWQAGAITYLQEGVIRNGIEEGWMRVIDVE